MSKKIETLTEFLDLVAEHNVVLKIEGDGERVCVTIGFPKGMRPKIRDAIRDWAADHEIKLLMATVALAKGWKPEGFNVEMEDEPPFQPITAIN